jgi:hypothetical protein
LETSSNIPQTSKTIRFISSIPFVVNKTRKTFVGSGAITWLSPCVEGLPGVARGILTRASNVVTAPNASCAALSQITLKPLSGAA